MKVLILEGDPTVTRLYDLILSQEGWQVFTCRDTDHARDQLSSDENYDLILVSYHLRGDSGTAFVRWLRRLPHRLAAAVMMVTGSGDIDAEARDAGVDLILHKPFELPELRDAARQCVVLARREDGERPSPLTGPPVARVDQPQSFES